MNCANCGHVIVKTLFGEWGHASAFTPLLEGGKPLKSECMHKRKNGKPNEPWACCCVKPEPEK